MSTSGCIRWHGFLSDSFQHLLLIMPIMRHQTMMALVTTKETLEICFLSGTLSSAQASSRDSIRRLTAFMDISTRNGMHNLPGHLLNPPLKEVSYLMADQW